MQREIAEVCQIDLLVRWVYLGNEPLLIACHKPTSRIVYVKFGWRTIK